MPRPRKRPGELGTVNVRQIGGAFRARVRVRDAVGDAHDLEAWGPTEAVALDEIRAMASKVWAGMFIELTRVSTVEQLASIWLADIDGRPDGELAQSSREAYRNRVNSNVLPYLSAVPIEALSAGFIHHLLQKLSRERSAAFASNTRKTLSGMLSFAVLNGVIETSPMRDVPKLKGSKKKKIQLDEDQLMVILGLVREWRGKTTETSGGTKPNVRMMEDFILIMLGTSYRPSEVLGLRPDDVMLIHQPAKVHLTGSVNWTKKNRNIRQDSLKHSDQERTMTVPKYTDVVLRRLVANYKPNKFELLLATKNGTPYSVNYVDRLFREFRDQHRDILSRIGIDVDLLVPYALRKTVASVVNEADGADLAALVLGHADPLVTRKHYIQEIKEVDPKVAAILQEAFPRLNTLMGG